MARPWTPASALLMAVIACLAAAAAAGWFATQQPWLGLHLKAGADGKSVVVAASAPDAPAAGLTPGATLVSVAADGYGALALRADDLIEEPDFFDSYEAMAEFFDRQQRLAQVLAAPALHLVWSDGEGSHETVATPRPRPLASLAGVFWFQLLAGSLGLAIGCWVVVLRPADWGARMFALTGAMFPFFTVPAAIYSSRELALDGSVFRVLASINHFGAFMFGCALAALFLCYPRLLVRPRKLLWLPAVFGLWLLADVARLAPDQDWGSRLPVMAETLLALGCGVIQWRRSRAAPAERAALRWLLLFALIGSGLFVFTTAGAQLLGLFPPLSQGYSFGYFLIMYAGLALGLRRYRLFDLDEWAYRILLWVAGALAVIAIDALLLWSLNADPWMSLSTALLVCGWVYFPFRQWLWQRFGGRSSETAERLLPDLIDIAFAPSGTAREGRWEELLRRVFDPLEVVADTSAVARLEQDGLELLVPACGGMAARRMRHAGRGRRLFSSRDAAFAAGLCRLMDRAAESRDAYERGASEERRRIARDMHDDVGARLLGALLSRDAERRDSLLRETLRDLRAIVFGLSGAEVTIDEALADLRHECAERLEAAGIRVDWPPAAVAGDVLLGARPAQHLRAVLREAVSNVIKHSGARSVAVDIAQRTPCGRLLIGVRDDGKGCDGAAAPCGNGLANMRSRVADLGGDIRWSAAPGGGTLVALELPLGQTSAAAAANGADTLSAGA